MALELNKERHVTLDFGFFFKWSKREEKERIKRRRSTKWKQRLIITRSKKKFNAHHIGGRESQELMSMDSSKGV